MLVWASDLGTAEPLGNIGVRVLRPGAAEPIVVGTTDADGTLRVELPTDAAGTPSPVMKNGVPMGFRVPLLVVADRDGDATLALSTWSGGIGPWTFGLPTTFGSP